MKIEERVFRRLLEAAQTQASKDDPYGEYLFAKKRKDLKGTPAGTEEDTPEEAALFKSFADHYSYSDYTLGDKAPLLLDLIKQGKYTKLLAPPPGPYYRLITDLSVELLASMLGIDEQDLVEGVPTTVKTGGVMKPGGSGAGSTGIHSWSTNLDSSWIFGDLQAESYMYAGSAAVILKAIGGKNFFVNPEGMSNVTGMSEFIATQSEVISYGDVPFDSAVYIINTEKTERESARTLEWMLGKARRM